MQKDGNATMAYDDVCKFNEIMSSYLKGPFFYRAEGVGVERMLWQKLRSMRQRIGARTVRSVVKACDGSGCDFARVIVDDHKLPLPADDASDEELWSWVRRHCGAGVRTLPIDVKYLHCQPSKGNGSGRCEQDYSCVDFKRTAKQHRGVVLVMFEGVTDHLAVVPPAAIAAATDLTCGYESTAFRAPPGLSIFLTHIDQLPDAIDDMAKSATSGDLAPVSVTNPTSGIVFEGWRPDALTTAPIAPSNTANHLTQWSFESTCGLWEDIKEVDPSMKILWNTNAPLSSNFNLYVPGCGIWRIEHKPCDVSVRQLTRSSHLSNWDPDDRQNGFLQRRSWHFFYMSCRDGVVCIARNELSDVVVGGDVDVEFVKRHTFKGFADAIPYMKKNSLLAKLAIASSLDKLRPEDMTHRVDRDRWQKTYEEHMVHQSRKDRHQWDKLRRPPVFPSVKHMLDFWCFQTGLGLIYPLGLENPVCTHVYLDYKWKPQDLETYALDGRLPLDVWDDVLRSNVHCIPLRLEVRSAPPSCQSMRPLHELLALPRASWSIPIEDRVNCINICSILSDEVHQTSSARGAWYVLLPDGLTKRFDNEDRLQPSLVEQRKDGSHFIRVQASRDREQVSDLFPPNVNVVPMKPFMVQEVDWSRYVMNLTDGTINRELQRALTHDSGDGAFVFNNGQSSRPYQNMNIEIGEYRMPLQTVVSLLWRYGHWKKPAKNTKTPAQG